MFERESIAVDKTQCRPNCPVIENIIDNSSESEEAEPVSSNVNEENGEETQEPV